MTEERLAHLAPWDKIAGDGCGDNSQGIDDKIPQRIDRSGFLHVEAEELGYREFENLHHQAPR